MNRSMRFPPRHQLFPIRRRPGAFPGRASFFVNLVPKLRLGTGKNLLLRSAGLFLARTILLARRVIVTIRVLNFGFAALDVFAFA